MNISSIEKQGLINKVEWCECKIALKAPYALQYGSVEFFHSCFFYIMTTTGLIGIGESTPLEGYTHTSMEDIIKTCKKWSTKLIGKQPEESLKSLLEEQQDQDGFVYTGIAQALDSLLFQTREHLTKLKIPIIAGLEMNGSDLEHRMRNMIDKGIKEIKLKVGKDLDRDIANINKTASLSKGDFWLRIDANQGYNFDQSVEFIEKTKKIPNIRFLEQPMPVGSWDEMAELKRLSAYPLMLDEDIVNEKAIIFAKKYNACDYIKLKLMKCGSFSRTESLINLANNLGLKVIIGNGVQSDIGCVLEMIVYQNHIKQNLPGEMNGFTRMEKPLLSKPLIIKDGHVITNIKVHPFDLSDWNTIKSLAVNRG